MRDTRPLFLAHLLPLVCFLLRTVLPPQPYNTMVFVPGRAAVAMLGQMRANWLLTIVFVAGSTLIFYPYAPPTAPDSALITSSTKTVKTKTVKSSTPHVYRNHTGATTGATCCLEARWRSVGRGLAPQPACVEIPCHLLEMAWQIGPTLRPPSATAGSGVYKDLTPMRDTPVVTEARVAMLAKLPTYVAT